MDRLNEFFTHLGYVRAFSPSVLRKNTGTVSLLPLLPKFRRMALFLTCHSHHLDRLGAECWARICESSAAESELFGQFLFSFTKAAGEELARRAVVLKDADLNLFLSFYCDLRSVPENRGQRLSPEWLNAAHVTNTRERIESRDFSGQVFSGHMDDSEIIDCKFDGANLSNSSFRNSRFVRCSFRNVLMVNIRLIGAEFEDCVLEGVDLSGAMLDGLRMWYPNHLKDATADVYTTIALPLPEERERSYELAYRNYGLYSQIFASLGRHRLASRLGYRMEHCRAHALVFGWQRTIAFVVFAISGYWQRPIRFLGWLAVLIFAFGIAYWRTNALIATFAPNTHLGFGSCLYFSIVTFTTLGFGDISPAGTAVGQILASAEVAAGMVGSAILVALLIKRLF